MEFFEDFLRMSTVERNEYVARCGGLFDEQRQELLSLNRIIASLLQQDAYWRGQMMRELKKLEATTRKDGLLPW